MSQRHTAGPCPYKTKEGQKWSELPNINAHNIHRCHEAIQIYTLVEVDAERQANEKTEFSLEKGYRCVGKRVVENIIDTPMESKDSIDFVESG